MRNPIHKRLANLKTWQHLTFMACLCQRMQPNFAFYSDLEQNARAGQIYKNILNLAWESLTVKEAKIDFDRQLDKLESIVPSIDEQSHYAVYPAIDACRGLADLLHSFIAGETLENAIAMSQLSLKTVIDLLEAETGEELSLDALKDSVAVQDELDVQWQIYRVLKDYESYNAALILDLKNELQCAAVSNIGVEITQNN